MKKIVNTNQELCVGCNRCTRECPIETANLTYQDEDSNIKVKIDNTKCIACGACISVCKHDARYYVDDIEAFFCDLGNGTPISLIVAPSLRTNFPEWKRLLTYLRQRGVQKVYDVSLGADICIWAHLRYIEQNEPKSLITQPCSAIVSYCEIHRPELLPNLSPIHSPMGCIAAYMREYEGCTDRIAALSPCIAKANEFDSIGMIDYNITFSKLFSYLSDNHIALPEQETGFDHHESGLGSLFPSPGGLKENMEYYLGKSLRIDRAEGSSVYRKLDEYAETPDDLLPSVFDVLNCGDGCNMGSGCLRDRNDFQIQSVMDGCRRQVIDNLDRQHFEDRYRTYDDLFSLPKFMRQYDHVQSASPDVAEADIQKAFLSLDKDTYAKQNFNCGACGSETCRDMARKIALNINIPLNCIIKSRDDTKEEHKRNQLLYQRNIEFIDLIHDIGENLLSTGSDEFDRSVQNSIQKLCSTLNAGGVCFWRDDCDDGGRRFARRICCWPEPDADCADVAHVDALPDWFSRLSTGEPINVQRASLGQTERELFADRSAAAVLAAPILIKGAFWGFIVVHRASGPLFDEEEVSVTVASGALIASSIIEKELTESLIVAREQALTGAKTKSEFLARMSHEIRTPMNAVKGLSELLAMTDMNSLQRNYVKNIILSANSLLGIINDILDFSKIDANKFEFVPVTYHLAGLITGACSVINIRAEEKKLLLLIEASPNLPTSLIGDDMRIKQIVTNLLSNAVKYSNEGYIKLNVSTEELDGATWLQFRVEDSGIGIREEDIPYLFQAFSRVDLLANRAVAGTGLGLAIAKNLAIAMGGDIDIKSTFGEGSTFTLRIPQQVDDASPIAAVSNPASRRVLLLGVKRMKNISGMLNLLGVSYNHIGTQDMFDVTTLSGYTHCISDGSFSERVMYSLSTRMPDCLFAEIKNIHHAMDVSDYQDAVFYLPIFVWELANFLNRADRDVSEPSGLEMAGSDISLRDAKILVVDDNDINLIVGGEVLRSFKADVVCAESGYEAIRLCKETRFDMIFMDHMMPGMDGVETTVEIRTSDNPNRETPIVALTANVIYGMESLYLKSGMDDFIGKPIEFDDISRVLCKWLPKEKIIRPDAGQSAAPEKAHPQILSPEELIAALDHFGLYASDVMREMNGDFDGYIDRMAGASKRLPPLVSSLKAELSEMRLDDFSKDCQALHELLYDIGARDCAGRARKLAMAGRERNMDYLNEDYPSLMGNMYMLDKKLEVIVPFARDEGEQNLPLDEPQFLHGCLEKMGRALQDNDAAAAMAQLERAAAFSLDMELDMALKAIMIDIERGDFTSAIDHHAPIVQAYSQRILSIR